MSTIYKLFGNLGCHTIPPVETKENYFVNYALRNGGQNNCEQNTKIVTDPKTLTPTLSNVSLSIDSRENLYIPVNETNCGN